MTDEIKFSGEVCKSFAIRNATYEHCSAILECRRSAFAPYRESYTPEAFLDTVLTPETLRHRLSEMAVFVATGTSGEIVGTIACKVLEGGEGHPRGMAVHPEWQGSGVSTHLLERAEDELRKTGCRTVTLDTTEPLNRASRFYERNGFQRTGIEKCLLKRTGLTYCKILHVDIQGRNTKNTWSLLLVPGVECSSSSRFAFGEERGQSP